MADQKVSNEQIYEKLKGQGIQLNLVMEHLNFHEKRFDNLDRDLEQLKTSQKEIRSDISALQETRFTWSAGIISGTVIASSILTIVDPLPYTIDKSVSY